ncbi:MULTISPECIES: phosphatase PAP2 family protein [Paenibacillus]|uniref:PAP2 superfamily protein n=1 Tax=Paenibacillus pabuli TaxID=1472 RepID=A0A855Y9C0_9BACL|nr:MULTISPECIES: phosphatase PAP2 family protein [Paenibacillus]PWW38941.1 PAP2 superfamily protein [Paenibacillus pabuli]PXW06126.1 PAP2 superfamily protein [Paenibacillus taichungensis]
MKLSNHSYTKSAWFSLIWLAAVPILNIFYGVLNRPGDHVNSLATSLDHMIPFVPSFIILYVLWYPFITGALIALAFKDKRTYFQTLIALCSGLVISYIFFALFQTAIDRPDIRNEKGFIYTMVSYIYSQDQPYNCFPSIHVLTSYLILRGTRVFGRAIWAMTSTLSILIMVSTVLVKQHVAADIAGGILVGELCFRLAGIARISISSHKME